ncbi:hypothetical protein SCA6_020391 [Theobroma cacao]
MSDVTDCYHYFQEFDALVAVLPSSEGGEEAQLRRIAELQAENDAVGQELQKQLEAGTFSHPSGCLLDLLPSMFLRMNFDTGKKSLMELINEVPPIKVEGRIVACEGDSNHDLGHPIEFMCLDFKETAESVNIMEGGSGSSYNPPALAKPLPELETLQKQHEEKTLKIQELKRQIVTVKLCLEKKKKKKKNIPDARKEAFNDLSEKYSSLREEYNALLAERSREQN